MGDRRCSSLGSAGGDFFYDRLPAFAAHCAPRPPPAQPVPAAYQIFWNRFVTSPQQPWVIFSNASFVGHPETKMHYFNAASDPRGVILDHYTGVGEVLADSSNWTASSLSSTARSE